MPEVAAVTMVKDEADVIEGTIRHMLDERVDLLYVADNNSTDGTRDILSTLEREFTQVKVFDDSEVAYYQSQKMTGLASKAADAGASWIIPFDADEIWYDTQSHLADRLRNLPPAEKIIAVPLWNHFPSGVDPLTGHPFERIIYRQPNPGDLPKVCFRWEDGAWIAQGNHGVTLPSKAGNSSTHTTFLRHFPYRSFEQFMHKAMNGARAYKATNLPEYEGAHWRQYGALLERGGRDALREVFDKWFHFPVPAIAGLVCDPAPYMRWTEK